MDADVAHADDDAAIFAIIVVGAVVADTDTVIVDINTFDIIQGIWCGFQYCWLVSWFFFFFVIRCMSFFDDIKRIKLQYLTDVFCLVPSSVGTAVAVACCLVILKGMAI